MSTHLNLVQKYSQTMLARLPEIVQRWLRNPVAKKTLAILVTLGLLRSLNNSLSQWTMNNWTRAKRWQPTRELVLITGGCSGIGKQIMEDLVRTGVRVVILDLNEPTFTLPVNVSFYRADITSSASIAEAAAAIRGDHGEPTVLINNAGVGNSGTIIEEPEAQVRRTFEVNTVSHFLMVKEFVPAMVRANHGHIVTIASMASFMGVGTMAGYCGSKVSALAFHECLRQELRHWYDAPKVRTSIVHPTWVRTPMIKLLTDHEAHFHQPILTVQVVSDAICKQILAQNSGQIILPANQAFASLLRAMPIWIQEGFRSKMSRSLKTMHELEKNQK